MMPIVAGSRAWYRARAEQAEAEHTRLLGAYQDAVTEHEMLRAERDQLEAEYDKLRRQAHEQLARAEQAEHEADRLRAALRAYWEWSLGTRAGEAFEEILEYHSIDPEDL